MYQVDESAASPDKRATMEVFGGGHGVHCEPLPPPDHDSGAVFRIPGLAFNRGRPPEASWPRSSSSVVCPVPHPATDCVRCLPRRAWSSQPWSTRSPWALAVAPEEVKTSAGVGGKRVQVAAVSTPKDDSRWRWRIVNYAGELIEESRETFPTIASAVEHGSKRLSQMDVVDNSVPFRTHRSTRHLRVP